MTCSIFRTTPSPAANPAMFGALTRSCQATVPECFCEAGLAQRRDAPDVPLVVGATLVGAFGARGGPCLAPSFL